MVMAVFAMTLPALAGAVDGWGDNTAPDPRLGRTTSGGDRRQPDVARRTVGVTADCAWVPASVEKIVPSAPWSMATAHRSRRSRSASESVPDRWASVAVAVLLDFWHLLTIPRISCGQ